MYGSLTSIARISNGLRRPGLLRATAVVAISLWFAAPLWVQTAKPATKPATLFDLNGDWQAQYSNPDGVTTEQINVVSAKGAISGTKTTGDQYVPAGKITLRGTYTFSSFSAEMQCAEAGYSNPRWGSVTITVVSADHFTMHADCPSTCACGYSIDYERVSKPAIVAMKIVSAIAPFKTLAEVPYGESFSVEVQYAKDPGADIVSLSLETTSGGTLDATAARVKGATTVFRTGPILVQEPEAVQP